jgi:hypothetical protein
MTGELRCHKVAHPVVHLCMSENIYDMYGYDTNLAVTQKWCDFANLEFRPVDLIQTSANGMINTFSH